MNNVKLKNCKTGDYIEVLSNGNGLLKNITIGKKYEIENVLEKGLIKFGSQNSKIMFRIRNDKNIIKWYATTMECWFSCFRNDM